MKPLLIEIGSEEIPARFVSSGLSLLKKGITDLMDASAIEYGNIEEYATPRRIALIISETAEKQKDRVTETLGPPKRVAFDDNGSPTKAATGFAKSLGLDIKDLTVKETERGEYLSATIEEKGRPTIEVLAEKLPEVISSLQLPKSMRWGDSSLRYFRPIQWILSMFGNDLISFSLEDIQSGNTSYGHRFLAPKAIQLAAPDTYIDQLRQHNVIVDIDERKKLISDGIKEIEQEIGCKVVADEDLLDTVTNLIECPTVVAGSFEDKFLPLPDELLITVMKSHQKYFSTVDESGKMRPYFVLVSNTAAENNDTVRKGAERVLRARLEDARFYYEEDTKVDFSSYTDELKKVTFQEKLGSVYEKSERIASLCSFIAEKTDPGIKENLLRSAVLCKADLVTGVVGEFPELQGYIGMKYAEKSGEAPDVSRALYEHYLPRFAGDRLPSDLISSALSIADKMDSIASFFYLGMIPTGSEDPYALRRQASGIVHILQSGDYPLTLDMLIDHALSAFDCAPEKKRDIKEQILQFFNQRLQSIFQTQDYTYDVINAVLADKGSRVNEIRSKLDMLTEFKNDPAFTGLLTAAKRVYNILSKAHPGTLNTDLLNEPAEQDLNSMAAQVQDKVANNEFRALFELEAPINTFFDQVLVMDKDPLIKENRIALLSTVRSIFDRLGDFSQIVE